MILSMVDLVLVFREVQELAFPLNVRLVFKHTSKITSCKIRGQGEQTIHSQFYIECVLPCINALVVYAEYLQHRYPEVLKCLFHWSDDT